MHSGTRLQVMLAVNSTPHPTLESNFVSMLNKEERKYFKIIYDVLFSQAPQDNL